MDDQQPSAESVFPAKKFTAAFAPEVHRASEFDVLLIGPIVAVSVVEKIPPERLVRL